MSHLLHLSSCLTDKWCYGRRAWITAGTFSPGLRCSSELSFFMFMPNSKIIYWQDQRVMGAKIRHEVFSKNIKKGRLCSQVTSWTVLRGTLCLSRNGTEKDLGEVECHVGERVFLSARYMGGTPQASSSLQSCFWQPWHLQLKQGFIGSNVIKGICPGGRRKALEVLYETFKSPLTWKEKILLSEKKTWVSSPFKAFI